MKILAHIPIEKVHVHGGFTFRTELIEVEVVRVIRNASAANKALNRWRYAADIKSPAEICQEAHFFGADGLFRVNVYRRGVNPKWVPPVFPPGANWVDIEGDAP